MWWKQWTVEGDHMTTNLTATLTTTQKGVYTCSMGTVGETDHWLGAVQPHLGWCLVGVSSECDHLHGRLGAAQGDSPAVFGGARGEGQHWEAADTADASGWDWNGWGRGQEGQQEGLALISILLCTLKSPRGRRPAWGSCWCSRSPSRRAGRCPPTECLESESELGTVEDRASREVLPSIPQNYFVWTSFAIYFCLKINWVRGTS